MSFLVKCEILGVFVNKLVAGGKYPLRNCKSLPLPIQIQVPKKRKTFSEFFVLFQESTSIFKSFEKKDDRHN